MPDVRNVVANSNLFAEVVDTCKRWWRSQNRNCPTSSFKCLQRHSPFFRRFFLTFQAFSCGITSMLSSSSLTIGCHTSSNVLDICRHVQFHLFISNDRFIQRDFLQWVRTWPKLLLGFGVAVLVFDEASVCVIRKSSQIVL